MIVRHRRRPGVLLLLAACIAAPLTAQQPASSSASSHGIDPANIDKSVNPAVDFYKYAEGGWMAANPVPPEYSRWGSFNELLEKNMRDLHAVLEDAAASTGAPKTATLQKLGDFYASAMDSVAAEQEGIKPLADEFARISALNTPADLPAEIAHLHIGIANPLFGFFVNQDEKNSTMMIAQISQGGLGLPDRDYYTKEDDHSRQIRDEYVKHVEKIFELAGDDPATAAAGAKTVMAIETRLAKASMTRVERRDPNATYHRMTLGDLRDLAPGFGWSSYFTTIGKSSPGPINVQQPAFFKEVSAMMADVPMADWKMYLRWNVLDAAAPWLSSAFVAEDFHFRGEVMTGAKEIQPRWKRALRAADRYLGDALGMQYVKRYFPPAAKARALAMIENLREAFKERLKRNTWMTDDTKSKALDKLDALHVKVGYPDKWKDYSTLTIDRGPFILNVARADEFESKRDIDEIGGPVDRTKWSMTPPTVNAYYNPQMNEIVFPAGILQPPFFDPQADDAVNYGGMGAAIGHEMTHGFDDEGNKFDSDGNLKDWWTPVDRIAFDARAHLLEEQFSSCVVVDTIHENGKLTLGENIADLGGLSIAFAALKKAEQGKPEPPLVDGFTPEQRFFLAWAQIWRANYRDAELRRLVILDPHAVSSLRVNCPLSDMPEFQKAFGLKAGDPMVRPEQLRASIW
ncbi:MAG TPA: M13 family metallopeptidase [Bacteroidota bacterium]|nr:M13 family metallopeptidase [Bacteroidota bacterium]